MNERKKELRRHVKTKTYPLLWGYVIQNVKVSYVNNHMITLEISFRPAGSDKKAICTHII